MKRLLFAAIFTAILSFGMRAEATLNCSVTANTNVGDNVNGSVTLFFRDGGTGYSWDAYSSTGHVVTWGPPPTQSGSPGSAVTFNWTYTADAVSETFTVVQLTGSTNDTCSISAFSTSYQVIPNWKKQVMNAWSVYFDQVKDELGAGSIACQIASGGDARAKIACITIQGLGVVAGAVSKMLARPDPWDPNFQYAYDPPWFQPEDLGLSWVDDGFGYYNNIVSDMEWIAQYADGAAVTADRVFSCHLAGDPCESWQRDRLNYFLYMWGWYLNDLSGNLWVEAWIDENYFSDLVDAGTIQQMRDIAQSASDAGNALEQ